MKFMAIIFAVFFLGLSVMPCVDNEQVSEDHAAYQHSSESHDHDAESDFCSPLCVCSCCHINFTVENSFYTSIENSLITDNVSAFFDCRLDGYSTSILHPPKA